MVLLSDINLCSIITSNNILTFSGQFWILEVSAHFYMYFSIKAFSVRITLQVWQKVNRLHFMICEIISANLGDAQSDGQNYTSRNLVLYMVPRVHVCTLDGTFLCTESLHRPCII